MIRTILAVLALAASTVSGLAATDDALREQILGSWGQEATCSTGALTFAPDGTLTFTRTGAEDKTGTWSIAGGLLSVIDEMGKPVPDATIVFGEDTVTFSGTDRGKPFEQELTRCPG